MIYLRLLPLSTIKVSENLTDSPARVKLNQSNYYIYKAGFSLLKDFTICICDTCRVDRAVGNLCASNAEKLLA